MKSTRTKKRQGVGRDELDLWDDFWSAMTSAFAEHQRTATSSSTRSATTRVDSTSTNSMANAAQAPTTLTVTISTTILSTTFITAPIPVSTGAQGNEAPSSTSASLSTSARLPSSSHTTSQPWSSTIAASGAIGTSSQVPTSPVDTSGSQTSSPPSATSSETLATGAANSTTDSMIGAQAEAGHSAQKKAIVGGLSASIAGLLLIGVVVCLFLRRRRKRTESKDFGDWSSEKGMRPPTLARKWTGGLVAAVGKGSPKQTPDRPRSMVTVTVDEEHRIIRMNTKHWVRPYAPGAGEGYRESVPPGQLRVVNPDPSPARLLSDSTSSFMKKQRSGLSGFVFGTSRPNSVQKQPQHNLHPLSHSQIPPTITVVDPALSRECVASYDQTPSFRSYPSVTSVAIVQQYPVDDPFLTPPQEEGRQPGDYTPAIHSHNGLRRPSLATLQNVKGSASRTISHLGSHLLHPFRSKPTTPAVQRNPRSSMSTDSTRPSRRSDPFDLDAPSVMHPSPNPGRYGPSANGNWTLYEGT